MQKLTTVEVEVLTFAESYDELSEDSIKSLKEEIKIAKAPFSEDIKKLKKILDLLLKILECRANLLIVDELSLDRAVKAISKDELVALLKSDDETLNLKVAECCKRIEKLKNDIKLDPSIGELVAKLKEKEEPIREKIKKSSNSLLRIGASLMGYEDEEKAEPF